MNLFKRLPKSFWVLIAMAGVVLLALAVGLVFESNPEWRVAVNQWSSEILSRAKHRKTTAKKSAVNKASKLAILPAVKAPQCRLLRSGRLHSSSSEFSQSGRWQVLSWVKSGVGRSFYAYDRSTAKIRPINLAVPKGEQPSVALQTEVSFGCFKNWSVQRCLQLLQPKQSHAKADFGSFRLFSSNVGILQTEVDGKLKSFSTLPTVDGWRLRSLIGYCGNEFDSTAKYLAGKSGLDPFLVAASSEKNLLAVFDPRQFGSYSPREVPRSPGSLLKVGGLSLVRESCRGVSKGRGSVAGVSVQKFEVRGDLLLAVIERRGGSGREAWLFKFPLRAGQTPELVVDGSKQGAMIYDASFVDDQTLAVSAGSMLSGDDVGVSFWGLANFPKVTKLEQYSGFKKIQILRSRVSSSNAASRQVGYFAAQVKGFFRPSLQLKPIFLAHPQSQLDSIDVSGLPPPESWHEVLWVPLESQKHIVLWSTKESPALLYAEIACR